MAMALHILFFLMSQATPENQSVSQGEIPIEAKDPQLWQALVQELDRRGMVFGEMAAAGRMVVFFHDLPTKEFAFQTMVRLTDSGYPFSPIAYFATGDLDPQDMSEFSQTYALYKGILNLQRGLKDWAENYFKKIDKEKNLKFLFYQAVEAYGAKDYTRAQNLLEKILQTEFTEEQRPFAIRVARTLARLLYEKRDFHGALRVYKDFLLRLNPVVPEDFIEASWAHYQLGEYDRALGLLFNLQSKIRPKFESLELYLIRALTYRNLCLTRHFDALRAEFSQDYGALIESLKRGESLSKFERLERMDVKGNSALRESLLNSSQLKSEHERISRLPSNLKALADYLYRTERQAIEERLFALRMKGRERSAKALLTAAEQLEFVKFEVIRAPFNPETVFQVEEERAVTTAIAGKDDAFEVRWEQRGGFWRDERLAYRARIRSECTK